MINISLSEWITLEDHIYLVISLVVANISSFQFLSIDLSSPLLCFMFTHTPTVILLLSSASLILWFIPLKQIVKLLLSLSQELLSYTKGVSGVIKTGISVNSVQFVMSYCQKKTRLKIKPFYTLLQKSKWSFSPPLKKIEVRQKKKLTSTSSVMQRCFFFFSTDCWLSLSEMAVFQNNFWVSILKIHVNKQQVIFKCLQKRIIMHSVKNVILYLYLGIRQFFRSSFFLQTQMQLSAYLCLWFCGQFLGWSR